MPLVVSLFDVQYLCALKWSYLSVWGQWYRVVFNGLLFTDQIRAIIAAELFYEFRAVERALGTTKYRNWVLKVWGATVALTPLLLAVMPSTKIEPGPVGLLVALAIAYSKLIPPVFLYSIKGIATFSDKTLIWLLAPNLWDSGVLIKVALGVAASFIKL